MSNFLRTGTDWLGGVMKDHASDLVSYRRTNGERHYLSMTPGETEAEVSSDQSINLVSRIEDYLVTTADFEFAFGRGARPEIGDEIHIHSEFTCGTRVQRVCPAGGSLPCWRFSDTLGNRIRIHTQLYSQT